MQISPIVRQPCQESAHFFKCVYIVAIITYFSQIKTLALVSYYHLSIYLFFFHFERTMRGFLSLALSLVLAGITLTKATPLKYTGVNEAGADFGSPPGVYGSTYEYPTFASIDHFISKGVNIFRIPFLWERMQPTLGAALDSTEFGRLDNVVQHITKQGAHALLDPHNYDKWYNTQIGSGNVTFDAFNNFWQQLAGKYASNSNVIFGLMNEPNSETTELVLQTMQAGMDGIRASGAKNLVTVPGNAWTGAHSWTQNWYGTPNSEVMGNIKDSANNWVFEMHQYLDGDYSGQSATCQSATVGSEALQAATTWLKSSGYKAFLGEFGGGANSVCYDALNDIMSYMEANSDVWVGWTYWAAGPLWGDYIYTIEPDSNGNDQPQFTNAISKHLQSSASTPESSSTSKSTSSKSTSTPKPTSTNHASTSSSTKPKSSSSSKIKTTTTHITKTSTSNSAKPTHGSSSPSVSSAVFWQSASQGYGINMTITFPTAVTSGWSITVTLANAGDTIQTAWGISVASHSGATYTFNANDYNKKVSAEQNINVGFNVNSSANRAKVPSSVKVKVN